MAEKFKFHFNYQIGSWLDLDGCKYNRLDLNEFMQPREIELTTFFYICFFLYVSMQ